MSFYFSLAILLCAMSAAGQDYPAPAADMLLMNARVYTLNPRQPWAEAVAVRADAILAAGSTKDLAAYRGPATKVIDAGDRLVLPGFTDCHIHFMDGSLGLTQVNLNGAKTVAEIQKRVKEYASSHPNEPWITGMGWTYPTFGESALPDKKKTEGSIESGKLADLIVLSQDLFKIDPMKIGQTEVLLTMVGGKVVYQSPDWPAGNSAMEVK